MVAESAFPQSFTFHGTVESLTKMTGTVGGPLWFGGQTCKWTAIMTE